MYSGTLQDVKLEKSNSVIERNLKSFGIDLFQFFIFRYKTQNVIKVIRKIKKKNAQKCIYFSNKLQI